MKKIVEFLRSMGFFRISSGDFQTGDIDNRSSVKKSTGTHLPKNKDNQRNNVLFWIVLAAIVLFLFIILISYGFSLWFFIMIIVWGWFIKTINIKRLEDSILTAKTITAFIVILIISFMVLIPSEESHSKNDSKNSTEMESGRITVNQATFSSFIFATNSDGGSTKVDNVHMTINPILSFKNDTSDESALLESFKIENLGFTKKPGVGEIKIIHPKHRSTNESCTGFYFGGCKENFSLKDIKDEGGNISYEITASDAIKQDFYDQISGTSFINPNFRIILHNIGEFDYNAIIERDGRLSGNKYAEYAEIEASDLASTLEFDVIAKFKDGEKFNKHFLVNFSGEDLLKSTTVQAKYK